MKYSTVKIEPNLLSVLNSNELDSFTVVQLRDAYIEKNGSITDPKAARLFVYGQIRRLYKLGLLKKKDNKNAQKTTYQKTPEFFTTKIQASDSYIQTASPQTKSSRSVQKIEELEKQLKQYKVDLLSSIGESEEYMRLYETNPDMKELLENKYHQAREQSSKLLGQIKAIKTVISHCQ